MTTRRFVLLDRDGTIIAEHNYLSDPAQVELLPGAAAGLRRMAEMGLGLVVVTNQSGVGRGYFTQERLDAIHARMADLLRAEGVELDGIYVCPHTPEDGCGCRKPRTGLVEAAAKAHGFDPRDCFVVGDKRCDVDLGRNVGATAILVRTGYGAEHEAEDSSRPALVVDDLLGAAEAIAERIGAQDATPRAP